MRLLFYLATVVINHYLSMRVRLGLLIHFLNLLNSLFNLHVMHYVNTKTLVWFQVSERKVVVCNLCCEAIVYPF